MDNREERLWAYIDGQSSEAEREGISVLLTTDDDWRTQYELLLQVHHSIAVAMVPDEPSMRFSKNVMEAIGNERIAPATVRYINPWVIRGLAAVFLFSILTAVGYFFYSMNLVYRSTPFLPAYTYSRLPFQELLNGTSGKIILCLNIVLLLVFLDMTLSSKRNAALK